MEPLYQSEIERIIVETNKGLRELSVDCPLLSPSNSTPESQILYLLIGFRLAVSDFDYKRAKKIETYAEFLNQDSRTFPSSELEAMFHHEKRRNLCVLMQQVALAYSAGRNPSDIVADMRRFNDEFGFINESNLYRLLAELKRDYSP